MTYHTRFLGCSPFPAGGWWPSWVFSGLDLHPAMGLGDLQSWPPHDSGTLRGVRSFQVGDARQFRWPLRLVVEASLSIAVAIGRSSSDFVDAFGSDMQSTDDRFSWSGCLATVVHFLAKACICWDRGKVVVTTYDWLWQTLGWEPWSSLSLLYLAMVIFLCRYLVEGIAQICSDWFFRVKT